MMETKDDNQSKKSTINATPQAGCLLGRLVDETTGQAKDPSQCIIQYGGRVRLPDKLVEILNKEFAPQVIWWQPDGECFAFDASQVQEQILDVWFRGTKLTSFIRSLNRWYVLLLVLLDDCVAALTTDVLLGYVCFFLRYELTLYFHLVIPQGIPTRLLPCSS